MFCISRHSNNNCKPADYITNAIDKFHKFKNKKSYSLDTTLLINRLNSLTIVPTYTSSFDRTQTPSKRTNCTVSAGFDAIN